MITKGKQQCGTDDVARSFREIDSSRFKVTVPKPTQVGEKKILRRARELSLRNSANYPRNFGRRGATVRDDLRDQERNVAEEKWPRRLFNKNTALCKVV